ncbi:MAG: TRAP transporter small permease subunit [Pseudomonadota bacterium]
METPILTAIALWVGDFLQRSGAGASPFLFLPFVMIAKPDYHELNVPVRAGLWAVMSLLGLGLNAAIGALFGISFGLTIEAFLVLVVAGAVFTAFSPQALVSFIGKCSGVLLTAAAWLGLAMAVFMLANVVMRYVFAVSYGWSRESVMYAFAGCFLLASAGALRDDGHVRVDIFRERMSARSRAIVDLTGSYVLLLPMMMLALSVYAPQLANAWGGASGRLETSRETDGLPLLFLFKTLVPVFAATLLLQGWANAMKAASILAGAPLAEEEAQIAPPAA